MQRLTDREPEIAGFRSLGAGRILLQFCHGPWVEVDLTELIAPNNMFAPLLEDEFLAQVVIGDYGHWIEWPGEIDLPADALWRRGVLVEIPAEPVTVR
jgi:Protein of unknown function (DUF2442)